MVGFLYIFFLSISKELHPTHPLFYYLWLCSHTLCPKGTPTFVIFYHVSIISICIITVHVIYLLLAISDFLFLVNRRNGVDRSPFPRPLWSVAIRPILCYLSSSDVLFLFALQRTVISFRLDLELLFLYCFYIFVCAS